MALPFLACMVATAAWYHLPPRVLPSIHAVEGGRPGLTRQNTNGSVDFGLMQVNSLWIPSLARLSRLPEAEVRARLIHDACFNIAAAGAILRGYLDEANGALLVAVGWYHSHTPARGDAYRARVLRKAELLFTRECAPDRARACAPPIAQNRPAVDVGSATVTPGSPPPRLSLSRTSLPVVSLQARNR